MLFLIVDAAVTPIDARITAGQQKHKIINELVLSCCKGVCAEELKRKRGDVSSKAAGAVGLACQSFACTTREDNNTGPSHVQDIQKNGIDIKLSSPSTAQQCHLPRFKLKLGVKYTYLARPLPNIFLRLFSWYSIKEWMSGDWYSLY